MLTRLLNRNEPIDLSEMPPGSVHETGFAIYFLMPFVWTRPDRRDWEALAMMPRMVAILAGPFTSQALAGLDLAAMMGAPHCMPAA